MKGLKYILIACLAPLAWACDTIDSDDRYIEMEPVNPQRAVLIEEFTGQNCTNCPDGHAAIAKLVEQYGDAVVPVCIHAGRLSDPTGFDKYQGLAIPDGEVYYKEAGSPNIPCAVIDGVGEPLLWSEWADAVRVQLAKPAPADIDVKASFSEGKINITAKILAAKDLRCRLQVWLVENGIVTYQQDHNDFRLDYVHNHVLRGVVNGVNGQEIALKNNVYADYSFAVEPQEKWNVGNMAAVVFIENADGVQQAAQVKVLID